MQGQIAKVDISTCSFSTALQLLAHFSCSCKLGHVKLTIRGNDARGGSKHDHASCDKSLTRDRPLSQSHTNRRRHVQTHLHHALPYRW